MTTSQSLGLPMPHQVLGPGGILSEHRPAQIEMAHVIERAMAYGEHAIVEAETGTGKTFAYAYPAVLQAKRKLKPVIISTGTKALQGQILNKDFPFLLERLRDQFGIHFSFKVAKGRASYLSIRRFRDLWDRETGKFEGMGNPDIIEELQRIRAWLGKTENGDFDELDFEPSDWLRAKTAATRENCRGRACPTFNKCYYQNAREQLQSAEIIVCNHALLAANLRLGGILLPPAAAVIIDEAHQFPQFLEAAFTTEFRLSTFTRLRNDLVDLDPRIENTEHWKIMSYWASKFIRLAQNADTDQEVFAVAAPKEYAEKLGHALANLLTIIPTEEHFLPVRARIDEMAHRAFGVMNAEDKADVLWVQRQKSKNGEWVNAILKQTQLDLAPFMSDLYTQCPVIFTSATLSTAGNFRAFREKLGVPSNSNFERVFTSPFDFQRQSALYIPKHIPEGDGQNQAIAEEIRQIVNLTGGRAFCLFTATKNMHEVADLVIPKIPYPAMRQTDAPKDAIIDWFKRTPGAVLFATASFWEGVSIEGDQLSAVIIDRIPFAAPGDPVAERRKYLMECQKRSYFKEVMLPEAITKLKQGVGRLVRTKSDTGITAILDPRMWTKGYGKQILRALPPMQTALSLNSHTIARFFEGGGAQSA